MNEQEKLLQIKKLHRIFKNELKMKIFIKMMQKKVFGNKVKMIESLTHILSSSNDKAITRPSHDHRVLLEKSFRKKSYNLKKKKKTCENPKKRTKIF